MKMVKIILAVLLIIFFSNNAFAQGHSEDSDAIEKVIKKFWNGIISKNKNEFMKLFVEEEVSWVGSGSRGAMFSSPERFIDMLSMSESNYKEEFHNVEIWNDQFIGVVTFDYGFFENDKVSNWGKESWMLIKRNDEWKITSVNFSMIMAFEQPYPFEE